VHQNLLRFARRRLAQLRVRFGRSADRGEAAIVLDVSPGGGIPQAPSESESDIPVLVVPGTSGIAERRRCGTRGIAQFSSCS
jgi:hypothetical protein